MAISLAQTRRVHCHTCGTGSDAVVWVAIDLVEHPALRDTLADPATYLHTCANCGQEQRRREPLVVTNLDAAAPMLLGEAGTARAGRAGDEAVMRHVDEQLRQSSVPTPGPCLACPFIVLQVAARRDVGADARSPGRAVREVDSRFPGARKAYRRFLSEVGDTVRARQRSRAIENLHRVTSQDELAAALKHFPGLLSEAVRLQLERDAAGCAREEERRMLRAELELLEAYRTDATDGAWARYERTLQATLHVSFLPELAELVAALDAAVERDPETVVETGEQVIARARAVASEDIEALACVRTGIGYLQVHRGDRAAHVERGIELLQRAEVLLERQPEVGDIHDRRQTLANLAAAYGARPRFDPIANQQRALAYHERVLADVSIDDDGDLWAKTHTNLGSTLLELACAEDRRDPDGRLCRLDEIMEHFAQALLWRTFDRSPLDWAYTHVSAGAALDAGGGSPEDAIGHYDEAERGFAEAGDDAQRVHAVNLRASARISLAQRRETSPTDRAALYEAAVREATAAATWFSAQGDATRAGQAWWQISRAVVARRNGRDLARLALAECLTHWTPASFPSGCMSAAEALALLSEQDSDTELAATAWRIAADAAAAVVSMRASRDGRLAVLGREGDAFRRAAEGLVKAGRTTDAIDVIELGRARELATWLERRHADLRQLQTLDPGLISEYDRLRQHIDLTEMYGVASGDVGFAQSVEALAAVVEAIRAVPGQAAFRGCPVARRTS